MTTPNAAVAALVRGGLLSLAGVLAGLAAAWLCGRVLARVREVRRLRAQFRAYRDRRYDR